MTDGRQVQRVSRKISTRQQEDRNQHGNVSPYPAARDPALPEQQARPEEQESQVGAQLESERYRDERPDEKEHKFKREARRPLPRVQELLQREPRRGAPKDPETRPQEEPSAPLQQLHSQLQVDRDLSLRRPADLQRETGAPPLPLRPSALVKTALNAQKLESGAQTDPELALRPREAEVLLLPPRNRPAAQPVSRGVLPGGDFDHALHPRAEQGLLAADSLPPDRVSHPLQELYIHQDPLEERDRRVLRVAVPAVGPNAAQTSQPIQKVLRGVQTGSLQAVQLTVPSEPLQ